MCNGYNRSNSGSHGRKDQQGAYINLFQVPHSTDKAVILGLMGESPESVNTGVISDCLERLEHSRRLVLCGMREIYFDSQVDLVFHRRKALPYHPNGMCCRALDVDARYSG